MKSSYWLFLFIADAALHLITTFYSLPTLYLVTKPLLMILLAGYFLSIVGKKLSTIKILILLALLGSWFGDTFLMFQEESSIFFILGLSSFLIAHVAYIYGFNAFKREGSVRVVFGISAIFILYSALLLFVLWPSLGGMKIPVILYALVLTIMGIMGVVKNLKQNNWVVIGVGLFIISDSLLAYNKFVNPIIASRFIIMITYILAQFLIIKGVSQRIIS